MIQSKFLYLFKIKNYFLGIVTIVLFISTLFKLIADLPFDGRPPNSIFFFGIATLLVFFYFREIYFLSRVIIDDDGILNICILTNKKTFIPYSEIVDEKYSKIRARNGRGYITDGYSLTEFILANGSILSISADEYENYNQIVQEIRARIKVYESQQPL